MKLRVQPIAARERLAAVMQAFGGHALVEGDTLELFHPGGQSESPDHEQTELRFFLRAWSAHEPGVQAEVIA